VVSGPSPKLEPAARLHQEWTFWPNHLKGRPLAAPFDLRF